MDDAKGVKIEEANDTTGNEAPSADEPRILNEIIIPKQSGPALPVQPAVSAPLAAPAAPPISNTASALQPVSTPTSMEAPTKATAPAPVPSTPAPMSLKNVPSAPAANVMPSLPASAALSLADEVGLVRPPQAPAPSPSAPASESGAPPASGMVQILKAVKLPERYAFRAAADKKAPPAAPPAAVTPTPQPNTPAVDKSEAPAEQEADHSVVRSVHTLKQDLQEVVHDQRMTLPRAIALQEEKKAPEPIAPSPRPRTRHTGLIFACALLIFLGAAALGGVYLVARQHAGSYTSAPELGNSIVFAEQTASILISGKSSDDVKSAITAAKNSDHLSIGSILRIVPTVSDPAAPGGQRAATLSEFLSAIGAHPPADLLRALDDQFFFGIHTVDKNAPVLVVPVSSYDRAFAGMLAWEGTVNDDLAPIYTLVPPYTNDGGLPTNRTFSDDVMNNYDTRVLKNDAGAIEFYYSFPSRNVLIIAESPYSFTEIVSRLQAQHLL